MFGIILGVLFVAACILYLAGMLVYLAFVIIYWIISSIVDKVTN